VSDQDPTPRDVVETRAAAPQVGREPLIVIEPLAAFLDGAGLGSGPITVMPIGGGHSNITYALERGRERFVLRRPPRGPLPASTHDMLREARLLRALAAAGVRVPEVLAIGESPDVIGAPFYIMSFIEGHVLENHLPERLAIPGSGERIAEELVDALVELHTVDIALPEMASLGRPVGYLARQLRRFRGLLEEGSIRSLPELEQVAEWLERSLPETSDSTVVHGDYRLGNVMLAQTAPPRILALLDWEMATLGDPLADVGYMTAMWAEPADPSDPMLDLSRITRRRGFPGREKLASRYADRTGRDLSNLAWYQTLALWKAAIFLEGSYRRHLAGTAGDPYFARLESGVPILARRALKHAESGRRTPWGGASFTTKGSRNGESV
jgi:aminoglycoside phosphotransferase (APT) family kinase protein